MIKLTLQHTAKPIWFNIDQIKYFDGSVKYATGTDIVIGSMEDGPYIVVTETPDTVARLITEYKQRQMRLQAAYMALYKDTIGSYLEEEIISQLESEDRGE